MQKFAFHEYDRRLGLGGTDVAAIMNFSHFRSPMDVFMEKTAMSPVLADDVNTPMVMRIGKALEPLTIAAYEEKTGRIVRPNKWTLVPEDDDWVFATPDGFIDDDEVYEGKVALYGGRFTDDVPMDYITQVTWYMSVCGKKRATLAGLIGCKLRIFEIPYDESFAQEIHATARRFWFENVKKNVWPEPNTKAEAARMTASMPKNDLVIEADDDMNDLAQERNRLGGLLKTTKKRIEEIDISMIQTIDSASGMQGNGWKAKMISVKGRTTVNYKSVVDEANVPAAVISKYTKIGEPSKRFKFKFDGEEDDEE